MGTTEQFQMRNGCVLEDTMGRTYVKIAEEAFDQFLYEKANPIYRPELEHDADAYHEHENRKSVAGIKTIVFSAIALEAATFKFATVQLGEPLARRYLNKLDVVGKWIVIPRLVCGQSLREDSPAMNSLKCLVKARNALVHHKSKEWDRTSKVSEMREVRTKRRKSFELNQVPNAFKVLVLLSLELEASLGKSAPGPLPLFGRDANPLPLRSSYIEQFVHKCREIHRDNLNVG